MTPLRRDVGRLAWAVMAVVVLTLAPLATASASLAQESGVTSRLLTEELVDLSSPDGVLSVTRVALAPADRTDSLRLDGPVVIVIETGTVKVWTRAGTTLDGVPVTERVDTIYASKGQSLSIPSRVRFRLRAFGCAPAKLLFILLASPRATTGP